MKTSSFCKNVDKEVRKGDSCEGKPVPDVQVASEGMKNIGSVGNCFDNVQHDSKSNKMICQISDIKLEDD